MVEKTSNLPLKKEFEDTKGYQNPYIEHEQTTQWLKEKVQKDKQRSTKHTHKTKDRVTRTSLKPGGERRCSGRVSSSCSTNGTRRIDLVTNPVISHEWGKDREVCISTDKLYHIMFLGTPHLKTADLISNVSHRG